MEIFLDFALIIHLFRTHRNNITRVKHLQWKVTDPIVLAKRLLISKLSAFIVPTNVVVSVHLGFQKRHKGNITASVDS